MGIDTLPFRVATRQKQEEKERRLAKFELIQGGLGSGSGNEPPKNWLQDLPVGAQFAVESKMQRDNFMVLTLEVWRKTERTVRLWDIVADKHFADVNPNRFINSFTLLEIQHDPRVDEPRATPEKEKELDDG